MQKQTRTWAKGSFGIASLFVGLLAVGCGGSGGSSTSSGGAIQTSRVGPVAVSFSGHPQAAISGTSGTVSSVGQAGASFSTLSMNPTHNLGSTYLAFTRQLGPTSGMYAVPAVGSGVETLLLRTGSNAYPTVSQSGIVAYQTFNTGVYSLDTMLADGSQQKVVATNETGIPAISPNGATIAYTTSGGALYTIPSGGGTPTEIVDSAVVQDFPPVWSPNSSQIAFTELVSSVETVFTIPATGGGGNERNSCITRGKSLDSELLVTGRDNTGLCGSS